MSIAKYNNHIYNQDCVVGMSHLASNSANIIIADPPYNIGKDFGNDSDKRKLAEYIIWSKSWIKECMRILATNGTMFIYGFPEILAHISINFPLQKHRWLQWHYTNKNMPSLNFWQRSHESILCIWKEKPIFNRDDVREPYTQGFLDGSAGRVRPAGNCRLSRHGGRDTFYSAHEKGALPRDVIKVSSLAGGASLKERNIYCKTCDKLVEPTLRKEHEGHNLIIHPTQKPLELTNRLLLSCKPKGEFNILIPFCGSGSECKCALQNGGSYISYELNPDYITLAEAVINSAKALGVNITKPFGSMSKVPCELNLANSLREFRNSPLRLPTK